MGLSSFLSFAPLEELGPQEGRAGAVKRRYENKPIATWLTPLFYPSGTFHLLHSEGQKGSGRLWFFSHSTTKAPPNNTTNNNKSRP
jgi:hypothetical protein